MKFDLVPVKNAHDWLLIATRVQRASLLTACLWWTHNIRVICSLSLCVCVFLLFACNQRTQVIPPSEEWKTDLSDFFSKQGSNGKNMSNLSTPPKALENSDSSWSLKRKVSDVVNSRASLACRRNSSTIEGKHTCSEVWPKESSKQQKREGH